MPSSKSSIVNFMANALESGIFLGLIAKYHTVVTLLSCIAYEWNISAFCYMSEILIL